MTVIDLLRVARRNLLLLLVCALLGIGISAGYVFTRPLVYEANALGLVVAGDTSSVGGTLSGDNVAQQRAQAYVTLIGTRAVADRISTGLGASGDPGAASGSVSAAAVENTAFIKVTATGDSAQHAQDLANAGLQALTSEALRMETATVASNDASDQEREKLTSIRVLNYDPAALPSAPRRPRLVLYLLLGLLGGVIIGTVLAVGRRQLDVRVRTREDVEKNTGHAVLGVIPETRDLRKPKQGGVPGDIGHAGEAFRQLRTNLRFANVDNPPRAVVVTSANPGEGKSTIAAHLARLIAKSGQNVILVDCDLRRPSQAKIFGVDPNVGLTQLLAGDITVTDALVHTDLARLRVLPAGSIPPNPSELIGSRRMQDLIGQLADDAFVILDAPPLLAVTDAGILAVYSDGAILVSASGKTYKQQLVFCESQLAQVKATLLGSVLNMVPRKSMGDVLYGYGMGGHGYASSYSYYYDGDGERAGRRGGRKTVVNGDDIEVGVTKSKPQAAVVSDPATTSGPHPRPSRALNQS